jgi:hypothetical protein
MKTTILEREDDTRRLKVRFEQDDIVHDRFVNGCYDAGGAFDAQATDARITEVARGVAVKISVGAITNPPPPVEIEAAPAVEPTDSDEA